MKMVVTFLFLFTALTFILIGCGRPSYTDVCTDNYCFTTEVVKTFQAKKIGLMHRPSIADNEAMLFVYRKPGYNTIWMKNMNFAIDILWIDENNLIVDYKKSAPPCKQEPCEIYQPKKTAQYILETKAGKIDELNLKINDKLSFNQTF